MQQKVIENLYAISERLPKNDRSVAELEYCIKQVSSQNLYAEIDFEDDAEQDNADDNGSVKSSTLEKRQNQRRNLKQWYRQFTVTPQKGEVQEIKV